jgi:PAS domain S-box-containing protein
MNIQLVESLKKTNRLYAVSSSVNNMILHIKEKNKIFEEACRIAVVEGKFEMAWVGLLDAQTGAILPASWSGNEDGYLKCIREISTKNIPEGQGPTGTAVRDRQTRVANDFANDPRLIIWREEALKRGFASSIAIPIVIAGKGIGAFSIYSSEPNFFNETEILQLEALTANIAFALEAIENEELRKRVETEVIEKNNFINIIANSMPGLMSYWTRDLRCSFANNEYMEWFAKSSSQMDGIHLSELLNEEQYISSLPFIEEVLAGQRSEFERTLIKFDGSVRYILVQYVPHFESNEIIGFFVMGSDITQLKLTENQLKNQSEELAGIHSRYVSFLENMREGLQIIDFNYTYLFFNDATTEQSKASKEEFLGYTMMEKFPGIERTKLFEKIQLSMQKRIPQTFENKFIFPNGDTGWFEIRISPIPEGVLLLSLDINERKKIADELLSANNAREEDTIYSASRMAALGEMASGIAHEINNPLSIIIMKVSQLVRKYQSNILGEEDLEEGLSKIATTAQRIGKVVKGLSSISRNSQNDPMTKIKLAAVIEDTLQLCRERFNSHLVKLDADLSDIDVDLEIEGRTSQIMQVLLNLLNNAFDATTLLSDKWISLQVIPGESGVVIMVTDSGPGIPDQLLGKIMQPFFTTKESGRGTGLGLSISKGIIDEHQGQFYYQKNSSHTCFVIELPYSQKP